MDPRCSCELCELKELFVDKLTGAHLEIVCSGKVEKDFRQGESIIKEGTRIAEFTYLKSGLVKLFRSDNSGKEQIISIANKVIHRRSFTNKVIHKTLTHITLYIGLVYHA